MRKLKPDGSEQQTSFAPSCPMFSISNDGAANQCQMAAQLVMMTMPREAFEANPREAQKVEADAKASEDTNVLDKDLEAASMSKECLVDMGTGQMLQLECSSIKTRCGTQVVVAINTKPAAPQAIPFFNVLQTRRLWTVITCDGP